MRMRPLTDTLPKPLIKVAGRSMLDRQLDLVEAYGVEEAVVNVSYLGGLIVSHLSKRTSPRIRISEEEVMQETGGGIVRALPWLGDEPFFAMNSDVILCNGSQAPALDRLAAAWDDSMDVLLLLHLRERAIGFDGPGDFFLQPDGKTPRRRGNATEAPFVFTGTQILHPRLFKDVPEGAFSMNLLYDRGKSEDGVLPRVSTIIHDGDWLHVGDPDGLAQAETYFRR